MSSIILFYKRFLKKITNSKKTMILTAILGLLLAIIYSYFQSNSYKATSTIEIRVRQHDISEIDTKIEIIKSNFLINKALKKVDLSHRFYQKKYYKNIELYHNSPFSLYLTKGYDLNFEVISQDENNYQLNVKGVDWEYSSLHSYGQRVSNPYFNFILKLKDGAKVTKEPYSFVVYSPQIILDIVKNSIEIKQLGRSAIISIIYSDTIKARAKLFLLALTTTAIEHSKDNSPRLYKKPILSSIQLGEKSIPIKTIEKEENKTIIQKSIIALIEHIKNSIKSNMPKEEIVKNRPSILIGDRVLDTPQIVDTQYPPYTYILLLGILMGLFLGLVLLALRTLLNSKIVSFHQITEETTTTLIGVVPHTQKQLDEDGVVIPSLMLSESFRTIRNNLQFMSNDSSSHVIAITSNKGGEGKSTIVTNLAQSISLNEQRVIIVDLDMQSPLMHQKFNLFNDDGMSSVLSNNIMISKVIQYTDNQNLDIVTAGPYPPNPWSLIDSNRMVEVIDKLRNVYDVIILNTPSIGTDTTKNLSFADTIIYILRAEITHVDFIKEIDIMNKNIKGFSIVLNDVRG